MKTMLSRWMFLLALLMFSVTGSGRVRALEPGSLIGIGIVVDGDSPRLDTHTPINTVLIKDHLTIREVMPDSPAEKSGLQQGDEIIQVNDRNVGGMSLKAACDLIRGPDGVPVKITIIRSGESNALSFTITRAHMIFHRGT